MAIIHTRNLPQIGMAWGVKDDLEKLKDTLEMIEAVTYDAEKKQANEKAVRLWLKRLRNVVYDADDVLDEFSYKAMCGAQMNKCDKLKQAIPYNLKNSFTFLEVLRVDFTQSEDEHLEDPAASMS
ncbi:disease resistance protein RGA2-like [Papaver somniferum]|uniref:disease resistance protein RGA2-like n=1 Tax=Papaver somniferum TaxID=3469 RepID=UPI000E6F71B9|nr:disease resistance protein RGA2-like [Papaver somniferum]